MSVFRVRIPISRVGVLIGAKGEVKRAIEDKCHVRLNIDSSSGDVEITPADDGDVLSPLIA
ncbi:MAG: KH domain-containing protein, partial [Candidatus Bathyarchaeia archaeon]